MKMIKVLGQPSWQLHTGSVDVLVARTGGMVGPVTYRLDGREIRPYAVAPWAEEELPAGTPPLIRALRGDFFCLPFGQDSRPYRGERHPIHGECANGEWQFDGLHRTADRLTLRLSFATRIRPGLISKEVALIPGHAAIYQRHVVFGMRGPMSFGQHAILRFPPAEGSGRIATSPFRVGGVWPVPFEKPAAGGYSCLKPGAAFTSLRRVPLAGGGRTDAALYPAREGFEDAVILATDPRLPFGWTTVTFPGERFVWFSLKNPAELTLTLLWFSNGGRHYAPWNGRHRHVMGLEEITAMPTGLGASVAANVFSRAGLRTNAVMNPRRPTSVRSIHGVAVIPANFDVVDSVRPVPGGIELRSRSGCAVRADVDLAFIA